MKKILGIIILCALILWLAMKFKDKNEASANFLGNEVKLISYQNGNGALMIDYIADGQNRLPLSLAIDQNKNNIFEEDEWVLQNMMVLPKNEQKNKVYFYAPEDFGGEQYIKISLASETKEINTTVIDRDFSTLMDLDSVTDPENAMKGLDDINTALAQEDIFETTQEGVPDFNQKPGECAPTSAANGLTSLITKHGQDAPNPEQMIEELKEEMQWNRENGVQPDNFVAGKNAWAAKHGLPIRTTKVGDTHGIETVEQIKDALAKGASIELRIKFADNSGKAAGGHMVTVTGIHQGEGQTYLDINDPYTQADEGSETVEVRSNQITNYGPWRGLTVLSWGFIQEWETPLNNDTSLEPMTDTEVEGLIGDFTDQVVEATIESSFAHVAPGEYSEVYAAVKVPRDTEVCLTLTGPGVADKKVQVIEADNNGQAHFVWKITQYGTYKISGACGDVDVSSTVVVN